MNYDSEYESAMSMTKENDITFCWIHQSPIPVKDSYPFWMSKENRQVILCKECYDKLTKEK